MVKSGFENYTRPAQKTKPPPNGLGIHVFVSIIEA
jgi:hypothetical protein